MSDPTVELSNPGVGWLVGAFAIGGAFGAFLYRLFFAGRWAGEVDATLKAQRAQIEELQRWRSQHEQRSA